MERAILNEPISYIYAFLHVGTYAIVYAFVYIDGTFEYYLFGYFD